MGGDAVAGIQRGGPCTLRRTDPLVDGGDAASANSCLDLLLNDLPRRVDGIVRAHSCMLAHVYTHTHT